MTQSTHSSPEAKRQAVRITKGWFVTIVACGLAAYAVISSKTPVKSLELGPAKFGFGVSDSDPEKLKSVAENVRTGGAAPVIAPPAPASDAERKQIEAITQTQPAAPASAQLQDLVGTWRAEDGATYQIADVGDNALTFSEMSNLYGVPVQTAFGRGTWNGSRFEFAFNTLLGLPGVGVLQPGARRTLVGSAVIQTTGVSIPLLLMR